jgi:hypothetical protein
LGVEECKFNNRSQLSPLDYHLWIYFWVRRHFYAALLLITQQLLHILTREISEVGYDII